MTFVHLMTFFGTIKGQSFVCANCRFLSLNQWIQLDPIHKSEIRNFKIILINGISIELVIAESNSNLCNMVF
jgi:hypothetical protein